MPPVNKIATRFLTKEAFLATPTGYAPTTRAGKVMWGLGYHPYFPQQMLNPAQKAARGALSGAAKVGLLAGSILLAKKLADEAGLLDNLPNFSASGDRPMAPARPAGIQY